MIITAKVLDWCLETFYVNKFSSKFDSLIFVSCSSLEMQLSYQDIRFSVIYKNLGLKPKMFDFLV